MVVHKAHFGLVFSDAFGIVKSIVMAGVHATGTVVRAFSARVKSMEPSLECFGAGVQVRR